MSTRSVDDLVAAMGVDTGISKSEVSRICAGLDERVAAFRNRTLGHVGFPYVYLDATYVHVRDDALGQVVSRAVVIATGITAAATARSSASTSATARTRRSGPGSCARCAPRPGRGAPRDLRRPRRAAAPRSARSPGRIVAALPRPLRPQPAGPRSPRPTRRWSPPRSARSSPSPTPTTSEARCDEVTDTLADRFPKAAESLRDARTDVLAFAAFPREHWRKIWSNNPLERLNKEIKRRSNVVGISCTGSSARRSADSEVR